MKAEQLWASILQEAIQGKLVPQLESEPKVDKVQEIPEDVPFNIPEKWTWIQLGELVNYGSSRQIKGSKITSSTWVLDLEDIEKNSGKLLQKKYGTKTTSNKSCFKKGDVLYGKLRPYLNKVLIADEDGCCSTEIVPINVSSTKLKIDAEFLSYFLRSPYFVGYANSCAYGVKMPRLGTKDAKSAWVAIPPITEQRRIVARLQKIRSLVDTYCHEEIHLSQLITEFPDKLKASILQEAIQGRLVPQLESEPPVEQIGKLIDKIPFSIPYKWKWIQLKHATTKITDGTHHSPPSSSKGDFLYITAKNIKSSGVDLVNVTYVSKDIHEEIFKRCNPEPGDVLFIKDGATTGVVTINNLENPFSLLSSVALLKVKREILLPEFLVHVLRSQYTRELIARQMQGTGIPRVTLKKLKELWIPIPPLNEQYRISKKLLNVFAAIPCEN